MSDKKRAKSMLSAIKELISRRALQSNTRREDLADTIIDEIQEKYPSEVPPAWETVIKLISHTRNHEPSPLENSWQLGQSLDLPSEAIAAIFEVQRLLEKERDNPGLATAGMKEWTEYYTDGKMTTTAWPLTIREALWISRLYKINYKLSEPEMLYLKIHKRPIPSHRPLSESPYQLWKAANAYADYERLCIIAGIDFNTSKLDDALRSGSIGEAKYGLFSEYTLKRTVKNERAHNFKEYKQLFN